MARAWALAAALASGLAAPGPGRAGVAADLGARLAVADADAAIPILVTLRDRATLSDLGDLGERGGARRPAQLAAALRKAAARSARPLRPLLVSLGIAGERPIWIANAIALSAAPAAIRQLAASPLVASVALDATLLAPVPSYAADATPGWNLAVVGAPQLWSLGLDGRGVVVATLDTGVDVLHPDLGPRWRGGHGGWLDPFRGTASPYDAIGHGTQTTAIAVGGEAGVAPGASWIAAKIYDDAGRTTVSVVHEAFQWLLDPDGDPSTADAPDVVNASWGIGATNGCDLHVPARPRRAPRRRDLRGVRGRERRPRGGDEHEPGERARGALRGRGGRLARRRLLQRPRPVRVHRRDLPGPRRAGRLGPDRRPLVRGHGTVRDRLRHLVRRSPRRGRRSAAARGVPGPRARRPRIGAALDGGGPRGAGSGRRLRPRARGRGGRPRCALGPRPRGAPPAARDGDRGPGPGQRRLRERGSRCPARPPRPARRGSREAPAGTVAPAVNPRPRPRPRSRSGSASPRGRSA